MIDRSLNYGRHHVRRFLAEAAPIRRAVDLGAGSGDDLRTAREVHPEAELHAVDVDPVKAQRLAAGDFTVHVLDIEREALPFEDRSIDVVIANQVLEHVKEIFWIFHEISRVLGDDGWLIVGVPNLAAWHNRLRLLAGRQPTPLRNASAHVRGWTRRDLLETLEACHPRGYRLEGFGGSNFYPLPPAPARLMARVFPNLAWGIFMLLRKTGPYRHQFLDYPRRACLETRFRDGR